MAYNILHGIQENHSNNLSSIFWHNYSIENSSNSIFVISKNIAVFFIVIPYVVYLMRYSLVD